MDDVLVFSQSFDDHVKHLAQVLQVLQLHHFTLNPDKCVVAKQSIEFLSHVITKDSIQPTKDRIQAILDMPQPCNLAQANRFIGKLGWYRKFVPNFAQMAAPIHKVTNKTKNKRHEFFWGEEQISAVKQLKQALISEPLLLTHPHPNAPFFLATDASDYAIGGALKQMINGKFYYNYFLSRLLTTTERNYSTTEREALAIFWCMSQLENYLGGKSVIVYTDHKPLVGFHRKFKSHSKRIDKWLIKYQEMIPNIKDVIYRKGRNNGDADGMSRPEVMETPLLHITTRSMTKKWNNSAANREVKNPTTAPANRSSDAMVERIQLELDDIYKAQCQDPLINKIKTNLKRKDNKEYIVQNDVL